MSCCLGPWVKSPRGRMHLRDPGLRVRCAPQLYPQTDVRNGPCCH